MIQSITHSHIIYNYTNATAKYTHLPLNLAITDCPTAYTHKPLERSETEGSSLKICSGRVIPIQKTAQKETQTFVIEARQAGTADTVDRRGRRVLQ